MAALAPCCSAPHVGLALGSDDLELALTSTDAWVTRLVCRAFRDRRAPERPSIASRVTSPARAALAIELGWTAEGLCCEAAHDGALATLEWARATGRGWRETTCAAAARGGHLATLRWARAHGCPWDHWTCDNAARGGHLEVLKWARANGCVWTSYTCAHAAHRGELEVLQWARAHGCPWDAWTWHDCANRPAVRAWLAANGCPRE